MPLKTLRVRARGTALVMDYEAMEAGIRRYIGRVRDDSSIDPAAGVGIGFRPLEVAVEVPATAEYARHVRHGDLYAADEATAAYCDVPFDASFGEDVPKPPPTAKSLRAPKE